MTEASRLVVTLALAAPLSAGAAQLRGTVEASASGVVLVDGGHGVEPVAATGTTQLRGLDRLEELVAGLRVEIEWSEVVGGVKVADRIGAPARWTIVDRSRLVDVGRAAVELLQAPGAAQVPAAVDVRDAERFEEGHVPGAVSAPLARISALRTAVGDLSRPLVVYSEDDRCDLAPRALRALRALGYTDVRVLEGGLAAWRRALLRIAIEPRGLARALRRGERFAIVDVRPADRTSTGSLPGAAALGDLETGARRFAGRAVDPPVVLAGEDGSDPAPEVVALKIEGYRHAWESPAQTPVAVLAGGVRGWREGGGALAPPAGTVARELADARRGEIGIGEFEELWRRGAGAGALLLDVRAARVESPAWALHVPLEELHASLARVPRDREVVVFCNVGRRSAIAYEILRRNGYRVRFLRGAPPR